MALTAHTAASGTLGSVTTSPINTTGATLIVIYQAHDNLYISCGGQFSPPALTDSEGNTWTCVTVGAQGGPGNYPQYSGFAYALNPTTSPSHTFTFSMPGTAPAIAVAAFSLAGALGSAAGSETTSSVTTIQPGAVTPPGPNSLVIAGLANAEAGTTIDSSFAITDTIPGVSGNNYGVSMAYLITGSAVNPTWTAPTAGPLQTSIVTFGVAAAAVVQPAAFVTP